MPGNVGHGRTAADNTLGTCVVSDDELSSQLPQAKRRARGRRREKLEAGTDSRSLILDATEQIMLEDGYAAITSRKVAERAGLKSKLLHYYFSSMDDLFVAAFLRREDWHWSRFASAAASETPLHDLWALNVDAASSRLYLEFNALAGHRPAVREAMARSNSRDRITMAAALESVFGRLGLSVEQFPPLVVATTIAGLARAFATDRALGSDEGHRETTEFVLRLLSQIEKAESSPKRTRAGKSASSRGEKPDTER